MVAAGVPSDVAESVARLAAAVDAAGVEPLCDPLTLLRFLRARDGSIDAAASMYIQTKKWRAEYSMGSVMAMHGEGEEYDDSGSPAHLHGEMEWRWRRRSATPESLLTARYAFWGRLSESAVDGAPIIGRLGQADTQGFFREDLVEILRRALVAHLEDTLQCARVASLRKGRLIRAHAIIDAEGLGLSMLRHVSFVKDSLKFAMSYYPESLSSVTVVRAPPIAAGLWRAISPLLPPGMRGKFRILGEDFEAGLLEHSGIQIAMLPRFLGGEGSDSDVCATEAVPVGIGASLRCVSRTRPPSPGRGRDLKN